MLRAGLGNDVYVFCKGDGQDTIDDAGGSLDILRFRQCASPSEVAVSREATGLRFTITTTGDSVLVKWDPANGVGIERVEFPQDGTVWDKAMLDAWANRAPLAGAALSAQAAVQGSAFSFTVPLAAFSDADYADRLTFSAVLSTGEPLPAWLSFNSATRTLSGTPADADVGTPGAAPGAALSVTIRATDAHGLSAIQALNLTVANVNDAPVAAQSIAAQSATQDAAFTFTIPAGAFTDADARFGDVLSYTVLQADGAALPGWLNYDAATRTLTGTPLNADVGSFNLRVTATDTAGATAAGVFAVNVANVNDAPMAYADSGAVQEDVTLAVSGNLLANDVDIDVGTVLRVTSVGTVTGVYGTLALNANGAYTYTLDNSAANVQGLAEGQRVSDVFSYSVSDDDAAAPLTAASTLTITITGSNDAPVVTADTAIAREDVTLTASGNLLANDSDVDQGAVLSVVSPGTLVGAYGSLTVAANGAYTYTLNNASAAVQGLRGGEAVSDTFNYGAGDGAITTGSMLTVTVLGKNDAPVAQNDSAAVTEDATLTATGNLLANDSDMDRGTILTVAAPGSYTGAYGTLSLAANGAYTYTLNNASIAVQSLAAGQRVSDAFAYSVRDNDANPLSAAGTLVVNVTGSNDAPVVTADTAIAREDVTLSASGNLLLNDSDVDQGAVLSVASPGTFAGTYGSLTVAANGAYTYTLNNASAAVQGLRGGEAVTDTFNYGAGDGAITTGSMLTVTVIGTNDAPVTQNDSAAVVEDATLTATGNVLANDSDIDRSTVLSVAAPGSYTGAYGTLAIAANGSYTYTLNNAAAAVQSLGAGQRVTDTFAYTARDNDAAPLTAAGTLVVSVTGANDAPVLATAIAAQNGREAQAFSFTVPVVTFSDADQGDRLTYGAQLLDTNGVAQALPSWLVFNPATRSFAGSPGLANGGSYQLRVTATDLAGASVSGNFALTILDSFASANGSTLTGSAGGDTLNGTNANEAISGLGGNDRLFAGAGADTLSGGLGADVLDAGAGDDTLLYTADARWGDGAYVLNVGSPAVAGTGARIELENRNRSYDQFIGAAGRDTLVGTSAGDVIALDDDSGPLGALGVTGPRISGIEVINAGDGNDVVDLTSTRYAYGDVTIDGGNGDDVIWSNAGSDTLIGGAGNDQLVSGAGADSLDGGSGSDTLVGGSGNDTYLLGRGYGNDTIIQAGSAAGDLDTARFLNGISVNQLWFGRHGNDLQVSVIGTSDRFSIDRWYKTNDAGGADINKVEQFQTSDGGKTLLAAQVQNLVNAMAAFAPPAAGQTSLSSAQSAALNPVIAANWH